MLGRQPPIALCSRAEPFSVPSSKMLTPFSSRTLQCTCRPLPASSSNGLGMKEAISPCFCATPLIRRFIMVTCLAASTGLSTCCILISYCEGADSLTTPSNGRSCTSQAMRRSSIMSW